MYRDLAGCAVIIGTCVWLILASLADASSVTRIYGGAVTLPSSIEPLCQAPNVCPDFWDFRPTESPYTIYGNRANVGAADVSCLKSVDGGRSFSLCPTNYPVTTVPREIDIPASGAILSMRFEGAANNRCLLDKSTDGGVTWTQITIVAGANLQCAPHDGTGRFLGEKFRCIGAICIAAVRFSTTFRTDIYRSVDNGDTWVLVSTGVVPTGCALAQGVFFDGTVGIVTCENTSTGAVDSTRVSVDSGATWAYIVPPANIGSCGPATILPGFDTGYAQACYNTTLTGFRFISSNAVGKTPTIQPASLTFNGLSNAGMIGLDSNNIWIFTLETRGRIYKVNISGDVVYEIPESVSGAFVDARLLQGRAYQGAMMATTVQQGTNSARFTLFQGN